MLAPLQVTDAAEMADLLGDRALYRFMGGHPATVEELRERYARLAVGSSPDGREAWRNWIARRRSDVVARALGMSPTSAIKEGEVRWRMPRRRMP